jgi:hypothetical protein
MIAAIIRQLDFNLAYACKLVDDLSDEQMTESPFPGFENHPAFTLGHLVTGTALMIEDLGGKMELPAGWGELFIRKGPGDPGLPSPDKKIYPGKQQLLSEFGIQHDRLKKILLTLDQNKIDAPIKWRFSSFMPSAGDLTLFMCVNHEAMHLGQLAAWRRAMGMGTALGRM